MSFSELGLSAELLLAVEKQGYDNPTPIQQQAIPQVIANHDLLGGAQTGTGKTAAFTLPLLHRLQSVSQVRTDRAIRALVLVPTRELAVQVKESIEAYGEFLSFKCAQIFGGVNINPQISQLRRGVDIVVATPGRLLDHVQRRTIDLQHIEILILDEADRMLDMGFIHDIRRILSLLPKNRQTLLFSATFSSGIRNLAREFLNKPKEIQVTAANSTAERVTQLIHPVDQGRKREMLSHMIGEGNWQQVLVFTRTKHGANRLSRQLQQDGLNSAAIHGNKSQSARQIALKNFKDGSVRVLVATDVAARGLDINLLPHVVNFDLPNVPEDYVHRIGRTARAGQQGHAISLVSADELPMLRDIERLLKQPLERQILPGYEPTPTAHPRAGNSRPNERRTSRNTKQNATGRNRGHKSSGRSCGRNGKPAGKTDTQQANSRQPRFTDRRAA